MVRLVRLVRLVHLVRQLRLVRAVGKVHPACPVRPDPPGEDPRETDSRNEASDSYDPDSRYETEDLFDLEGRYAYSDLGMGLLGHVLERAAGASYDELIRELLGDPIKLANTANAPTQSMRTYLADGHDDARRPVPAWSDTALVGGTGLRSNLLDMMTLVSANMGIIYALPEDFTEDDSTRYHASFDSLIVTRDSTDVAGIRTALGWKVRQDERGRNIHWLTGRTNGFYAFAAFIKAWRKGVVVLSNSSADIEDIGFHLLSARNPLAPPPKQDRAHERGRLRGLYRHLRILPRIHRRHHLQRRQALRPAARPAPERTGPRIVRRFLPGRRGRPDHLRPGRAAESWTTSSFSRTEKRTGRSG